jgi:hypothetical protein
MTETSTSKTTRKRAGASERNPKEAATANLAKLPPMCGACCVTDNTPILVVRGENGTVPAEPGFDPDEYNRRHEITAAQREAMVMGALFGWEKRSADPDFWAHDPMCAKWREGNHESAFHRTTVGHLVDESEFPRDDTPSPRRN